MAQEDGFATSYYYSGTYDSETGVFTVGGSQGNASYVLSGTGGGDPYTLPVDVQVFSGSGASYTYLFVGYSESGWVWYDDVYESYTYATNDTDLSSGNTVPLVATGTVDVTPEGIAAVCFMEGTRIACPEGERLVEDIAIGDLVLTASGETLPVRWIGRQAVATVFADPLTRYPIRISAGALGGGLPRRDLFVSPTHALLVEGLLIQARALLNGTTIAQVRPQKSRFGYYHLEFERHAVVLAEGMPAESFVDSNESRRRFDNYAEFEALYGPDAPVAEPSDIPRVTVSRQLPRRLAAKLAAVKAKTTEAGAVEAA